VRSLGTGLTYGLGRLANVAGPFIVAWVYAGLALQLHSTLKCLLVATFRSWFRQLPLNILSRSTMQL